jgi:hypothetical protein
MHSEIPRAVAGRHPLVGASTDRGGLDLLRWLGQKGLAIPAVVVTGSTELHEIREAMRLGALGIGIVWARLTCRSP